MDNAGDIGDTVYNDANNNGQQDASEPGLAGVTVQLYQGATLLASTVTDAQGNYLFEGWPDGAYTVKVVPATLPTDFIQTADPDVSPPQCTNTPSCDNQGAATVTGGGQDLTVDFGSIYGPGGNIANTYTLRGVVWEDRDGDGLYEPNGNDGLPGTPDDEPAIPGATVVVSCTTGLSYRTTGSLFAGSNWSVSGVAEGSDCTIDVDESTLPSAAYAATTAATLNVANITGNVTNLDFGYRQALGEIGGTVCVGSGDGVCDPAETPLSPVTVTLIYAGPDGFLGTPDDLTRTTTTSITGTYVFTGLVPGVYQVLETNLPGYASVADADGFDPDNITVGVGFGPDGVAYTADDRLVWGTRGLRGHAAAAARAHQDAGRTAERCRTAR